MKTVRAILLLASVAGCADSAPPTLAPNVTAEQRASAAQSMGLTFPSATRLLLYHRVSEASRGLPTPDDAVRVKIELSAPALAEFVSQSPLSDADWTGSARSVDDHPAWPAWRPSQAQRYRATQLELPAAQVLSVLIDEDAAGPYVVYLEGSEL